MLTTDHLTKHFGKTVALEDLSLEVPRGEVLVLVGPNGAGKTTALKLMVGLLQPTAGAVSIAGVDVHRDPVEAKRHLSFIPDQPFLYEQLTVFELLGFVGGIYRMTPAQLTERATALVEVFGLNGQLTQRVGTLSYGMRSRVVLVANLLHRPHLLIMDEPFFGLDPQTLRLIKQLLRQEAQGGMTVVLSTHQLAIVEDVAHRIAIMAHGRIVAMGSLTELKARYGGDHLEELFFQLTTPPSPAS